MYFHLAKCSQIKKGINKYDLSQPIIQNPKIIVRLHDRVYQTYIYLKCYSCDGSGGHCQCYCLCGRNNARRITKGEEPIYNPELQNNLTNHHVSEPEIGHIYRCFNCVTCGKCGNKLDQTLRIKDDNFVWDYGELPICHACYKFLN